MDIRCALNNKGALIFPRGRALDSPRSRATGGGEWSMERRDPRASDGAEPKRLFLVRLRCVLQRRELV